MNNPDNYVKKIFCHKRMSSHALRHRKMVEAVRLGEAVVEEVNENGTLYRVADEHYKALVKLPKYKRGPRWRRPAHE